MAADIVLEALIKSRVDSASIGSARSELESIMAKSSQGKTSEVLRKDADESIRKNKELGVVFDWVSGTVNGLATAVKGMGLGLLATMTGAVALSPQFKEMLARLKPVFFELSNFLGTTFKPVFDAIVDTAGKFVHNLIEMEGKYHILKTTGEWLAKLIEGFGNLKGETQLSIIIGGTLAAGLVGNEFKNWLLGAIGIKGASLVGGSVFLPGLITIGASIVLAELLPKIDPALTALGESTKNLREYIDKDMGGLESFMSNENISMSRRAYGGAIYTISDPNSWDWVKPMVATLQMFANPVSNQITHVIVEGLDGKKLNSNVVYQSR